MPCRIVAEANRAWGLPEAIEAVGLGEHDVPLRRDRGGVGGAGFVGRLAGGVSPVAASCSRIGSEENDHSAARVLLSTYPTMMNLIEEMQGGQRRFGPGHFDLVMIDEAHRSAYRKYRAIFDYFDSLLVGLTATPRDEIDRDTYSLFGLERGVPTDAFDLDEAVDGGFLVPPEPISVPLKFQRQGIRYADLSEEETRAVRLRHPRRHGLVPKGGHRPFVAMHPSRARRVESKRDAGHLLASLI